MSVENLANDLSEKLNQGMSLSDAVEEVKRKTKSNPWNTTSGRLSIYNWGLNNAKIPEIAMPLSLRGYPSFKMDEGRNKLESATSIFEENEKQNGIKKSSHESFEKAKNDFWEPFWDFYQIADVAFRHDAKDYKRLQMDVALPTIFASKITRAEIFVSMIVESNTYSEKMLHFGYSVTELNDLSEKISNVKLLYGEYQKEDARSQDLTKKKNAAIKEIDTWMKDFYDIAKIALKDSPQLMEALGKKVKS